ncbi:MAG: SPOR domain-containing protein [Rickettsiales bacterium]
MRNNLLSVFASFFIIFSIFLATITTSKNASAFNNFYLEIGKYGSIEEVENNWDDLSSKYKSKLGNLSLYPKTVVTRSGDRMNVIQAGSIGSKTQAQDICNFLFSKGISCFVISGVTETPPNVSVNIAEVETSEGYKLLFPWQNDRYNSTIEIEANVDIAEAMPVPLSGTAENIESDDVVIINSGTKKSFRNGSAFVGNRDTSRVRKIFPAKFSSEEAGILNIQNLISKNEGRNLWRYARSRYSQETSGLRASVRTPLNRHGKSGIQVNIWTFRNGIAAFEFCNNIIMKFNTGLKCSYNIGFSSLDVASEHSKEYESRRKEINRRLPKAESKLQKRKNVPFRAIRRTTSFWVQLVIADSKAEAKRRWAEIKKENAYMMKNLSARLISSSTLHAKYTVRVGPLNDEREAGGLCGKLQRKAIDCLVVVSKR